MSGYRGRESPLKIQREALKPGVPGADIRTDTTNSLFPMARYPSRSVKSVKRVRAAPIVGRMLPFPDHTVRRVMIGYHQTLTALREKRGDFGAFATLARVIVCASHLFDAGFGEARVEGLTEAHDALERNVQEAAASGVWGVDAPTAELFSDLLTLHEAQLRAAPVYAVNQAMANNALSSADVVRSVHRERQESAGPAVGI